MRAHHEAALPPLVSFVAETWATRTLRRASIALATIVALAAPAAAQQEAIVQPGFAVVTGYAGFIQSEAPEGADPADYTTINTEGPAARVIDLTNLGPQGTLSDAPKPFTLTASQVGEVFGVTLDNAKQPNIYLAASSAYGLSIYVSDENGNPKRVAKGEPGAQFVPGQFGPPELGGGTNAIWKVDGVSGEVSLFAVVDSGTGSVAALGALAFDPISKQIFASERGTGVIYRIGLDGTVRGTFDHGIEGRPGAGLPPIGMAPSAPVNIESPAFDTGNPQTWGTTSPARRVFGLAVRDKRIYYSVAQGPQIWSAAIGGSGSISGSGARIEVEVPSLGDGIEISSITFDGQGRMYLAERGPTTGDYSLYQLASEGQSRVLRYVPKPPGDPSPGRWRLAPDQYSIGLPEAYNNANGGVVLNYGYRQDNTINLNACGATLWSTGERLLDPGDGSEGFPTVDGIQGNSTNLFQPNNMPPMQSWFVDYDDQLGDVSFRGYMGAIATIQCAGKAPPPPLPLCPSWTELRNGQCIPLPCPEGQARTNQGKCVPFDCPEGQGRNIKGQCVPFGCPEGQLRNNQGQCVPVDCPEGKVRNNKGQCVSCPQGTKYDDGVCVPVCPQGQIMSIEGQCVPTGCDQGEELFKGNCVPACKPDETRMPNGKCMPVLVFCNLATHEFYNNKCVPKCTGINIHFPPNGVCKPPLIACNLATHEFVNDVCVPKCVFPKVRKPNGTCGLPFDVVDPGVIQPVDPPLVFCNLATHEFVNSACVVKCVPPKVRKPNGTCGLLFQLPGDILAPGLKQIMPACAANEEIVNGDCKPKCVSPQARKPNGSCGLPDLQTNPVIKLKPNLIQP